MCTSILLTLGMWLGQWRVRLWLITLWTTCLLATLVWLRADMADLLWTIAMWLVMCWTLPSPRSTTTRAMFRVPSLSTRLSSPASLPLRKVVAGLLRTSRCMLPVSVPVTLTSRRPLMFSPLIGAAGVLARLIPVSRLWACV